MSPEDARQVLLSAFAATGEIPPAMLALLGLLIEVPSPAPSKRRRKTRT